MPRVYNVIETDGQCRYSTLPALISVTIVREQKPRFLYLCHQLMFHTTISSSMMNRYSKLQQLPLNANLDTYCHVIRQKPKEAYSVPSESG